MASSSLARSIHSESHYKNTYSSGFKKTFFLEDWWLIKAEKEIQGKRLAVAGFTCRDTHQARRLFSSAPILKIHDIFTLETTDGICVILEGFINKPRTEENGFTSDVFKYFVFGFPPYWEEYAEKCMCEGFGHNAFSRMASASPQNSEKAVGKVSDVDGNKKDMGVEGCEDIVKQSGQHRSDCTESSVEVPKELGVDFESGVSTVDHEGTRKNVESSNTLEKPESILDNTTRQPIGGFAAGLTTGLSELEGNVVDPSIVAMDGNITAEKDKSIRKSKRKHKSKSLSGHTKENDASNCILKCNNTESKALEAFENSEKENLNNKSSISLVGFGKEKIISEEISSHSTLFDAALQEPIDEVTVINPDTEQSIKLSSNGAKRKKDKNCGQKASISKEASTTRKKIKRKLKYDCQVTGIKQDPQAVQPSRVASSSPQINEKAVGKVSDVVSNKKDLGVEGCEDIVKKSGQHRSDCTDSSVEVPKELGVDFKSGVSTVDLEGDVESSQTPEIPEFFLNNTTRQPIGDLAKGLTTGLSGLEGNVVAPLIVATDSNITAKKDKSTTKSRRKHKLKSLSGHTKEISASTCSVKCNNAESNSALEALENSGKEHLNNKSSILPVGFGKEASTTRKKTTRKLKYETPVTRSVKERASILSPESLSSKRSRSGRLLLPTLEFWRNQTVIYDEDRQVTGIKQDLPGVQPSRGSKSEPQRKRKKVS